MKDWHGMPRASDSRPKNRPAGRLVSSAMPDDDDDDDLVRLAHTSAPNQTQDRRLGLSFHYMPTCTRQIIGAWDSAALVRGEDRFGHFEITPRPTQDYDPQVLPFHEKATHAMRDVLFKEAEKVRSTL